MKILNNIASNYNWMNSNSIERKWDTNRYWKFVCDYGVKKNFEMTQIEKDTFPLFGTWEFVKQLSILNYPNDNFWIIQRMTCET
jgi:hypothetical protein